MGSMAENVSLELDDEQEQIESLKSATLFMAETVRIGTHFAWTYIFFGIAAVLLNLTILIVLIIKRRHLFKSVFYMLIFNFALIDCVKGVCLITYALRMLKSPRAASNQMTVMKFDQYMTVIFRFCNLATILNLLMITLNEFTFIKYPFLYNRWVKKRLALFLICLNWVLCLSFTMGSTMAKTGGNRFFLPSNYTRASFMKSENSGGNTISDGRFFNDSGNNIMFKEGSSNEMDVHYVFAFTIIAFCLFCLIVVLICYASFIRVIRAIRLADSRLYSNANRQSDYDIELSLSVNQSQQRPNGRASVEDRKIKGQLLKRNKYAIVIGSVILVYTTYLVTYSAIQVFQYIHLSNDDPNRRLGLDQSQYRTSNVIRWSLQILVGLHSVFQPLCYFRMREFRRFVGSVLCYPFQKSGQFDRDYYTVSMGAETHGRGSFANTRAFKRASSLRNGPTASTPFVPSAKDKRADSNQQSSVDSDKGRKSDANDGAAQPLSKRITVANAFSTIRSIFVDQRSTNRGTVTPLVLKRNKNQSNIKSRNRETKSDQELRNNNLNYEKCPVVYCNVEEL